jgi:hypothetical protein
MTDVLQLLTDLTSQPLAQSFAWLLSVTGSIDRFLTPPQTRTVLSGQLPDEISPAGLPQIMVSAADVTEYLLSRQVLEGEIRLWKGVHSFHPHTVEYAAQIGAIVIENGQSDISQLSEKAQHVIERIWNEYRSAAPLYKMCRDRLFKDAFLPVIDRVGAMYRQIDGPQDKVVLDAIEGLRTLRDIDDPSKWNRMVGTVYDMMDRWRPPPPPSGAGEIKHLADINAYLSNSMSTMLLVLRYTSRFLLADCFLNPGGLTATVAPQFQQARSPFLQVLGNGMGSDNGALLVAQANDRIMDCLGLLIAR